MENDILYRKSLDILNFKFQNELDIEIKKNLDIIFESFDKTDYDIFLVGGCVRDILMGRIPKDYDLNTNAPLKIVRSLLEKQGAKIIETGLSHGTITAHLGNNDFEITRFRKDISTDGRNATVEFTNCLENDLKRRDLTINSLAWNPKSNVLHFLNDFNGIVDINKGILRFVGDSRNRILEDHLRALRLIRFSVQFKKFNFKFNKKEFNNLILPIFDNSILSFERIIMELNKIFIESINLTLSEIKNLAEILSKMGLLNRFNINTEDQYVIFYMMLNYGSFWPLISFIIKSKKIKINKLPNILKLPSKDITMVDKINKFETKLNSTKDVLMLMKIINDIDYALENVNNISSIVEVKNFKFLYEKLLKIKNENLPFAIRHLKINGNDLKKLGYKNEKIGEKLNELLNLIISHNTINNSTTLINILNISKLYSI